MASTTEYRDVTWRPLRPFPYTYGPNGLVFLTGKKKFAAAFDVVAETVAATADAAADAAVVSTIERDLLVTRLVGSRFNVKTAQEEKRRDWAREEEIFWVDKRITS